MDVGLSAVVAIGGNAARQNAGAPAATTQNASTAPSTQPATIRFKRYVITDDQKFGGMEAFHGVMPVDWTMKGGVFWKMGLNPPDRIRIHWGDAQDVCAFDVYPPLNFAWSNEVARGIGPKPGSVNGGGNILKEPPTDQFDAFEKVIRCRCLGPILPARREEGEVADVANAIRQRLSTDPNTSYAVGVGRETFEYELNGQTVQEVISGVFKESTFKQNNPTGIRYWSVVRIHRTRLPKERLISSSRST